MVFGKKVGFFVGRYAQRVRQERRRPKRAAARSRKRRGKTKRLKPTCQRKGPTATIRQRPKILWPAEPDRNTQGCLPRRTLPSSPTVIVANVAIPAVMVNVALGRKHLDGGRWVLTSNRGMHIATFECEADLDRWWRVFQESMGREPRELRAGRIFQPAHTRLPRSRRSEKQTMPRGDYLKPWSERYDMPEIDLE